jgi:putative ABC transport system ATP-binding protein
MAIILCNKICKDYFNGVITVPALRGVSIAIEKGEFAAIAGPSGSGKTTLLNIIGGLDFPTSGEIIVGEQNLSKLNKTQLSEVRLKKIGFIFQAYNLLPVLSALENVEYILLLQGVGKEERYERCSNLLKEVGLGDAMHRRPHQLSGGQQQRVAIARAIVSKPDIVLADEPTANLDQNTGAGLLDLMHELNKKNHITFLFSTHDGMVMERSERLIKLFDGSVASDENKNVEKSTSKAYQL